MELVTGFNVKKGMRILDEGKLGTVISCEDLHNVHVILDGEGLGVKIDGEEVECGGSALYCMASGCEENWTYRYPIYVAK